MFIYKSLNTKDEPSSSNHEPSAMNHELKNPLYQYRTLAVTEAYARICDFSFKLLKNNALICGMCFYKQ
jgi:hypothetical protein